MNDKDIAEQAYINGYKKGVEDLAERLKKQFTGVREYRYRDTGTAWGEPCIGEFVNNEINKIVKELTASGEELTKPAETPCKHALKDELGDSYCGNDKSENLGDFCVCCGATIPEGRQVCPNCEKEE